MNNLKLQLVQHTSGGTAAAHSCLELNEPSVPHAVVCHTGGMAALRLLLCPVVVLLVQEELPWPCTWLCSLLQTSHLVLSLPDNSGALTAKGTVHLQCHDRAR